MLRALVDFAGYLTQFGAPVPAARLGFTLIPHARATLIENLVLAFDATNLLCCDVRVVIANFQSSGLLVPGIHWLPEKKILAELFGTNSHRLLLLDGFFEGAELLRRAGCRRLYLDGSFVTMKPFPSDFDCCWDTEGVDPDGLDPVFLDFAEFRARQKARFGGEFFPARAKAEAPWTTFLEYFQVDKESGNPKGIVGIDLNFLS